MLSLFRNNKTLFICLSGLFYLSACIWITPHGFDPIDSGALLVQYSATLDAARPVGVGTFLTVWAGHLLHSLVPSHQLLFLSLLTWVLFALEGLMVYRMVRPFLPVSLSVFLPIGGIFMNKFFDLLGYNNWSVFFFILMLFLLEQWMRTSRLFWVFLAGCMVGVSTGFRLPNLLQGTMVLGVFWYEWHSRSFQKAWGASLLFCVGGLFSLASVWGAYGVFYGMDVLFGYVPQYAGRLNTNSGIGYSAAEMLSALFSGLGKGLLLLFPFVLLALAAAAGLHFFSRKRKQGPGRIFLLAAAGVCSAVCFFFALNVSSPDWLGARRPSLCLIAAFCLLICLAGAFAFMKASPRLSTLCVFAIGMILIVTLGTNNGILFFMMGMTYYVPVAAAAFVQLKKRFFPNSRPLLYCSVTLLQWTACFSFVLFSFFNFFTYEYLDGRSAATVTEVSIPQLAGMKTTPERSAMYQEFMEVSAPYRGGMAVIYGSFPIGHYLSDTQPALGQIWPDLPSYSLEQLQDALHRLEQEQSWPPLIFAYPFGPDYRYAPEKWLEIEAFAQRNAYTLSYQSEHFLLYSREA